VDEGTEPEVADRAVAPLGLPMSPLMLLQLVGPAVAMHVAETLHQAYPDRFSVSPQLAKIVEAGKTEIFAPDFSIDPKVKELLSGGDNPSEESQILDRALRALAKEIQLMLDEGVVAEAADIDLCLITGAGWPFHTGGITPYLDMVGVSTEVICKTLREGATNAMLSPGRAHGSCPVERDRTRSFPEPSPPCGARLFKGPRQPFPG